MANGSVLASNRLFHVKAGETTTLPILLRQSDHEVSVIGSFDSESRFTLLPDFMKNGNKEVKAGADPVSILSQTGRGYFVVGVLGVGQEPTNHALRDIARAKADLDKWGRPLVLLFESESDARQFAREDYGQMPTNTDGSIRKQIAAQMKLQNGGQLPLFIIADTFNRVVFSSEGYTIGLGEQIVKVSSKL